MRIPLYLPAWLHRAFLSTLSYLPACMQYLLLVAAEVVAQGRVLMHCHKGAGCCRHKLT